MKNYASYTISTEKPKMISYKITIQDTILFKELLFKFYFFLNEGSVKFQEFRDLLFFKRGIVELFIRKSND